MEVNVDISSHNAADDSRRDQMRPRRCDGRAQGDTIVHAPCNYEDLANETIFHR